MARRPTSKSRVIQSKRSRRSKPSPYPHRGTPLGDLSEGTCVGAGCGIEVFRGDIFAITANGLLYCHACYAAAPGIDAAEHRYIMKAMEVVKPRVPPEAVPPNVVRLHPEKKMEQVLIWDGEFPE